MAADLPSGIENVFRHGEMEPAEFVPPNSFKHSHDRIGLDKALDKAAYQR